MSGRGIFLWWKEILNMNEHIIVGSITLPYSLSNTERLLWLEDWISSSSENLGSENIVELIFTSKESIDSSMKYLMNNKRWVYISGNEFYSHNGTIARFFYDEEADKMLTQIRR